MVAAMIERHVFENALLGFLCQGPAHGYDLSLHFADGGDLAVVGRLGKSQLYSLLNALEAQGLAEPSLQEGEGGPARRVFRITEEGRDRLGRWLQQPVASIRGLRVEFLLKLYFLSYLGRPGVEDLLDAQRGVLAQRLREVQEEREAGSGVTPWVFGLQESLLHAGLRWLDEWRAKGFPTAPPRAGRPPARRDGRRASNRLRARVLGHEVSGGVARVDLDLEGGRVVALVPREALSPFDLRPGGRVDAVLSPGGLVLERRNVAPNDEDGPPDLTEM